MPPAEAATTAAEPRVRFITHRGRQILFMDLSYILDPDDARPLLAENRRIVAGQPPASLLTLTYVEGSRFNRNIVEDLRELVSHNKPFVKAGALVGMSQLMRVLYMTIQRFTGRNIPAFPTLDETKNWLVAQ